MVDNPKKPPDGGGVGERKSYVSVLGSSLKQKSDKNVLEVVLEKDVRGAFIVKEQECANMMRRMGLDQRPGVEVEEVQICPQGRGVIFITLKKEVEMSRFCRHDVLDVTESGIRSVMVKPAGKREVVVTIKGIHPNTREEVVLDYLGKFGRICSNKVVYGVFSDGPLKGFKNGDRSYKLEINPNTNLGSYHAIDGQKVTLRYPGQYQTCGRCHQTAKDCKGKGIARKSEAEGGQKREFYSYILDLWKKIGYFPENLQLGEEDSNPDLEEDPTVQQQTGGAFTPVKDFTYTDKFSGVSIKQFPKEVDKGEIIEFIIKAGLPESKADNITVNDRGTAVVRGLDNSECLDLIAAIHRNRHFERKLFCNGVVALTQEKVDNVDHSKTTSSVSATEEVLPSPDPGSPFHVTKNLLPVIDIGSSNIEYSHSESFSLVPQLVRRHSISILDRSPPPNSIAAQLLASSNLTKISSKALLSDIADIRSSLSDFNSCIESGGETSNDSEDGVTDLGKENLQLPKSMNDQKRLKKRKRKLVLTPGKEDFLKKPNNQNSPQ